MTSTVVDRIATALREDILAGRLPLGSPLREEHLATRFEASRHSVRTALALLVGTGLVRAEPYAGIRVTTFGDAEAASLQDLRRALESEAATILHTRFGGSPWPAEVLEPIESAIERLAAAEALGDGLGVLHAHASVHLALVASAGSPRITAAHERLSDEIDLLLLHARPRYERGELERQHRALLADVQRLGAAPVRSHLADTLVRLRSPHPRERSSSGTD